MRTGLPAGSLPVSGLRVQMREPTGEDEVIALDRGGIPSATMLALARGIVLATDGATLRWSELPAVDLAAAALLVRRTWLGERISTQTLCPMPGCGAPIDVSFPVSNYLAHHAPRPVRTAVAGEDGWFTVAGADVTFRIPTIDEHVTAVRDQLGVAWLAARCIRPAGAPAAARRRVERALSVIAPRLDDHIGGRCPVCESTVELFFDPIGYVLAELRDAAAGLYADVNELAFAYHWSEQSILALDVRRRHGYAALVRGELALA